MKDNSVFVWCLSMGFACTMKSHKPGAIMSVQPWFSAPLCIYMYVVVMETVTCCREYVMGIFSHYTGFVLNVTVVMADI